MGKDVVETIYVWVLDSSFFFDRGEDGIERCWEGIVKKFTFVIDDLFRELDTRVISIRSRYSPIYTFRFQSVALPIRASGCGVHFLAPDDMNAASRCSERCDLAIRDFEI